MSEKLSTTIIAEALKQVRQISGCSQLLVILANRKADLDIVCCHLNDKTTEPPLQQASASYQLGESSTEVTRSETLQLAASKTCSKSKQETGDKRAGNEGGCCPLCNGSGELDFSKEDVIRLKLAPITGNNNNNNNNGSTSYNQADSSNLNKLNGNNLTPISGVAAAGQLSASEIGRQLLSGARSQVAIRLVEWLNENVAPLRAIQATSLSPLEPERTVHSASGIGESGISSNNGKDRHDAEHTEIGCIGKAASSKEETLEQVRRNYGHRRRSSIERLLVELRQERKGLAEQIELLRLAKLQTLPDLQNLPNRHPLGRPDVISKPTSGAPQRGARIGSGRPLNSSIQQMKRMDTLKRRKLKKEQLLEQEEAKRLANEPSSSSSGANQAASIRFARPLTGNILLATAAGSAASDPSIAEEEEDVEELVGGRPTSYDDDDDDDDDYEDDDNEDDHDDYYQDSARANAPERRGNPPNAITCPKRRQAAGRQRRAHSANQSSGRVDDDEDGDADADDYYTTDEAGEHQPTVRTSKVSNGAAKRVSGDRCAAPSGERPRHQVARDTAVEAAQHNKDKDASREEHELPGDAPEQRHTAYSYQGLRSSFANLVNEVSEQSRKKKFANLNPFANISIVAALNSFGSPVKRAQKRAASTASSDPERGGPVSGAPVSGSATRKLESRQHSSRSQSSGSAGGATSSSPKPPHRISRGSNCSCLKSSASSQSCDSLRDVPEHQQSLK